MRIPTLLLIVVLMLSVADLCKAQEATESAPQLSTGETIRQVEETLNLLQHRKAPGDLDLLRKAERELKAILASDPSSVFKAQVQADLDIVNERLAYHDLLVASFYMNTGHGLKGARARLQNITRQYPKFSKMDEVLFRLSVVSVEEESEAARYCWTLICNYPNSEYVGAAFERVNKIGLSSWEGCQKYTP